MSLNDYNFQYIPMMNPRCSSFNSTPFQQSYYSTPYQQVSYPDYRVFVHSSDNFWEFASFLLFLVGIGLLAYIVYLQFYPPEPIV